MADHRVLPLSLTRGDAMSTVTIAGGINMDVVAFSARLPLRGETISGKDLRYFPSGKGANQAPARTGTDRRFGRRRDRRHLPLLTAMIR